MLGEETEKGWLKNSVLDLARNNFDNVDYGLFEIRNPQANDTLVLEDHEASQSQFFLNTWQSSQNINPLIEKENKPNFGILDYTKPILKVVFMNFIHFFFKK